MARFYQYTRITKSTAMIVNEQKVQAPQKDVREDFNWGATIGVLILMLAFISATFYVLISSLQDLG